MEIKNIFNKIILFMLVIAMIFGIVPMHRAEAVIEVEQEPEVGLDLYGVYSVEAEKTILSNGASEPRHPFGLVKIMTALIAVEYADKYQTGMITSSEMVTVGYEIDQLSLDHKSAGFMIGDVVSLADLLTAMIVMDADDAAMVVARYIGRKALGGVPAPFPNYDSAAVEYFIELMNKDLVNMGCRNTFFSEPTGFVNLENGEDGIKRSVTTFNDLMIITDAFMENDFLREIISITSVDYWGVGDSPVVEETPEPTEGEKPSRDELMEKKRLEARKKKWVNRNQLMDPDSEYYYPNCMGLMICDSDPGIMFAVFCAQYHGMNVVVGVYAAKESLMYPDIIKLFDYVFNNYVMHTYVEDGQKVAEYSVRNAMDPTNAHLEVLANQGGKYLSRIDMLDMFNTKLKINEELFIPTEEDVNVVYVSPEAGIKKNTVVGTMDIYYGTQYIDSVVLYAGNTIPAYEPLPDIKEKQWYYFIDWENSVLLTVVIILIVSIFILSVSIVNNLKKQKRIRRYYAVQRGNKKPAQHYSKKKR